MSENISEVFKQFVHLVKSCNLMTSTRLHSIIQMFNEHSVYRNSVDKIIGTDNYEVNLFENSFKQHYCTHHFIPSPLVLFTWSKLMRSEIFRNLLKSIITSSYQNGITSLPTNNLPDTADADVIDLTNRNLLSIQKLSKLETLFYNYSAPKKDTSSPSSSYFTEPYRQCDANYNFESESFFTEWSGNNHAYHTSVAEANCESENKPTLPDGLTFQETLMLLSRNKEWVSNQPVKEFYTDSENDMKFYPNSGDMSHFFQSKCRFPWCDLYSENHSNDIHEQLLNCSAWKQSSPPSSLINEMVKTVNPSSSFTNFSMKVDHMDPNSSSLVSGELNLNDIKKSFLCRSKSQSSPPPPPPSSSYSPPLNFSAFTMDQNMLCPLCHKCFRFEKNLLRHLQKTHSTSTGESLLKCKLCNYTTRHYSNMYVHIRTHTGDKPYSCSACGVSFTQGSSLKLHIRSRHNDNGSYFSLIRKPGKNNLTKLWTRVLKKDLPKFTSFESQNSYYYYHYWNKWRHSVNIEQKSRLKNVKHKSKLNTATEQANNNLACSTSNEFQQIYSTKEGDNKHGVTLNYWKSSSCSGYPDLEPATGITKRYTKRPADQAGNERLGPKHNKRRYIRKTNISEHLTEIQKEEMRYSSCMNDLTMITEVENPTTQNTKQSVIKIKNNMKVEEPDSKLSKTVLYSTVYNYLGDQEFHTSTIHTTDITPVQLKQKVVTSSCSNSSSIKCQEEYLPFSIAALQPS